MKEKIKQTLINRPKRTIQDPSLTLSAVLLPLFLKEESYHVLLTKRSNKVLHHKGQISFPGGAYEPEDIDLAQTALRETYEEIGVFTHDVELLGVLDDFPSISNFIVTPYVGIIPYPYQFVANEDEIDKILEVPISIFIDPKNLTTSEVEWKGENHTIYYYQYQDEVIWGLTAKILKDFLDICMKGLYAK